MEESSEVRRRERLKYVLELLKADIDKDEYKNIEILPFTLYNTISSIEIRTQDIAIDAYILYVVIDLSNDHNLFPIMTVRNNKPAIILKKWEDIDSSKVEEEEF